MSVCDKMERSKTSGIAGKYMQKNIYIYICMCMRNDIEVEYFERELNEYIVS